MANRTLFKSARKPIQKNADTKNRAGAPAYDLGKQGSLAQYVVTSCFNNTFYSSAKEQVDKVLELAQGCTSEFIAKAAIYGHETARMKDAPAMLLAILSTREDGRRYFEAAFPRVITNGKMLMNFVQIIRSGVVGRRSFGSTLKRAIHNWLASRSGNALFTGSIGSNPSFADIVKMVHPKPESDEKKAFYAYMIGREHDINALPSKVQDFEVFKLGKSQGVAHKLDVPNVPFQMLSALNLNTKEWAAIARNMPWNALRMNLNTMHRHGVFNDREMVELVASKLADKEAVIKANAFPYQLLTAYQNTTDVPVAIRNALQEAMEYATLNVPAFDKLLAICPDVSGSMRHNRITGERQGASSVTTCNDVAALFTASLARKNRDAIILPFENHVRTIQLNPFDSVMTNAEKLGRIGGGGTNCSAPINTLCGYLGPKPEVVILISDNESWSGCDGFYGYSRYSNQAGMTNTAAAWRQYKQMVPNAKLILIDIVPGSTTTVNDQKDVFNVGGFSDRVWPAIENFLKTGSGTFVDVVNSVAIFD